MKVRFGDILEEGLRLVITDESWFPDKEIERRGPVSATVFLERKREGLVLLEGRIKTSITLNCDRCLEPFGLDLQDTFKVDLEVSRSDAEPYEHACSSTEMDTMVLAQPEIDIFQALRQQILLLLPEKRICNEGCKGLCPRCGADLNTTACNYHGTTSLSPFDVPKSTA